MANTEPPQDPDQRELEFTRHIIDTIREPMLILDAELRVAGANAAFHQTFRVEPAETLGTRIYELGDTQWDIPRLRQLLDEVLQENETFNDFEVEHDFPHIGPRIMLLNARKVREYDRILLAIEDITERKQAERKLVTAMEQAVKTIDTVREPMLVLGDDLRVRSANDAFYRDFGGRPEETEGMLVYHLADGQWDIPRFRELLDNVLPHDVAFNDYRLEHEFPGIGPRRLLLNARRIDHVQLILLAIEDVTERELAQEDLEASEARYRAIVESQSEMLCRFLIDGTMLFVNRAYAAALGTVPEALVGANWWDFVAEDDRPHVRAMLDSIAPESPQVVIESRFETIDGPRWTLWTNRALQFDDKGQLYELQSTGIDITDRKRAEQALIASEERFRTMADNAPVAVWVTDAQLACTYRSKVWYEITGQPIEAGLGFNWLDALHPDDRHDARLTFEEAAQECTTFRIEYRLQTRDGGYLWAIDSAAPHFDSEGNFLGYIGSIADISERKAAEDELRRANQLKDELLGMISHEFRTPLTLISGNIDILSRGASQLSAELQQQVLSDLRSGRDRLQRLIENMLLIARGENSAPEIEPIRLQRVLADIVEAERPHDTTRPITLQMDEELPPVLGNISYLEQIVENLVTNARKYGDPRTPVHISAKRDGHFGLVSVRNKGPMLKLEQVERFFEPFYQEASHAEDPTGAGLGLSVCARLVALMDGAITAKPDPDGGLEVDVAMPLIEIS